MKYIKLFESIGSEYEYYEYVVNSPGIITSHNYSGDLKMTIPFYLADGDLENIDYGENHQLFLILPGTKIVKVRSSIDIEKIDLTNLKISDRLSERIDSLLFNRSKQYIISDNNIKRYSELIEFAKSKFKLNYYDYIERLIYQSATIDYLKNIKNLDFQILEFTKEGYIAPNQYLVLDLDSIIKYHDIEDSFDD